MAVAEPPAVATRIDEPLRYDRNTDPSSDGSGAADDCVEVGGGTGGGSRAYFYHQEANTRVVMLSDQAGLVAERCDYTAYGEPQLRSGSTAGTTGPELGAARRMSAVGNPLLHQGLFRDGETGSYQNRYRQYASGLGRFAQRDPLGYLDSLNAFELIHSQPYSGMDTLGLGEGLHGVPGTVWQLPYSRPPFGLDPIWEQIAAQIWSHSVEINADVFWWLQTQGFGRFPQNAWRNMSRRAKQAWTRNLLWQVALKGLGPGLTETQNQLRERFPWFGDPNPQNRNKLHKHGDFWPLCCFMNHSTCLMLDACSPECCQYLLDGCLQGAGPNPCHGGYASSDFENLSEASPCGGVDTSCCFTLRNK